MLGVAVVLLALAPATAVAQQSPRAPPRRLFDLAGADHRIGFGAGYIVDRPTDEGRYRAGLELRWLDELSWDRSTLTMHSGLGSSLRLLHDGYALSLAQSEGLSGIRLGPVRLLGGVGLSLLDASWTDAGWGFGMFWPRSSVALCLDLGTLRVELRAHVEYLWNWFGTDRFVRGLGVTLSLPGAPVTPAFE